MNNLNDTNLVGNSNTATDFLGNKWTFDCIGCAIANHEINVPGGLIYESDNFVINHDPEIPIKGFLIINPKRHIRSLIEMRDDERIELIKLMNLSIQTLKALNITTEVTIIQEERSSHFHVWLFPHHKWMAEKFGKGIKYIRDICAYAKENATDNEKEEIIITIDKVRDYIKKLYY
ncbi:MAG: HIT family hydrolase [Bacilli bacterium]|nr:HIT family hydrolase [Bacilli bacterium]